MAEELMGIAEVAERLGVSNQRVDQLAQDDDFPAPVAVLKAGRIWRRRNVEAWIKRTGRR
jgi:predicted DNA-binding transcriptional regulator AlpA